jgi:hypothetical protein
MRTKPEVRYIAPKHYQKVAAEPFTKRIINLIDDTYYYATLSYCN